MNDFTLTNPNATADPDPDAHTTVQAQMSAPSTDTNSQQSDRHFLQSAPSRVIGKGRVRIDPEALRSLRQSRMLSQQDLADDLWSRNIQVSIATIKRAETGHAVRYRILRELARYFDVPFESLT